MVVKKFNKAERVKPFGCVFLSVFAWGNAEVFFEYAGKVEGFGITAGFCYLRDRVRGKLV